MTAKGKGSSIQTGGIGSALSRKEPKADLSREQILLAAARLFRDQGYAATTLRQIAAAAHMKAGSIYYHFSSKDQILDEVLNTGMERNFAAVKEAVAACSADADAAERVRAAMSAHLRTLLSSSEFTAVDIRIFGQLPAEIQARHQAVRAEYRRYWDGLFRSAIESGQFRKDIKVAPLRQFVLGALNWTVEWFDPETQSVDELIERCTELIISGVRKP